MSLAVKLGSDRPSARCLLDPEHRTCPLQSYYIVIGLLSVPAIRRPANTNRSKFCDGGHVGAVAFSRTGDPATGDFSDAKVIRKFGDVPDDLSAL
jgi:hypothetical protein